MWRSAERVKNLYQSFSDFLHSLYKLTGPAYLYISDTTRQHLGVYTSRNFSILWIEIRPGILFVRNPFNFFYFLKLLRLFFLSFGIFCNVFVLLRKAQMLWFINIAHPNFSCYLAEQDRTVIDRATGATYPREVKSGHRITQV